MIKILTVIGARPQIIKAAALSRAIKNHYSNDIQEIILHTGQHYDQNMSQVFFDELEIPKPNYNLNVGSLSHGKQTAKMIEGIEEVLQNEKPDALAVYGDTNSTLAAAVAASKIHIPVIHIEAGLRSFNKKMPEEINRILCDHASTLLFTPTKAGLKNLLNEGFSETNSEPYHMDNPGIFHCGDVMYDNSLYFGQIAEKKSQILQDLNLEENKFILGTIHRDHNTDYPENLNSIFSAIDKIAKSNNETFVLPLHPRTSKLMSKNLDAETYNSIKSNPLIHIIEPVSFFDMIALEKNAKMIMTDSGGVQKEAYFFQKPVIILRPQTEWVEVVEQGAGTLCSYHYDKIIESYINFSSSSSIIYPPIFGDGKAAEFICEKILKLTAKEERR